MERKSSGPIRPSFESSPGSFTLGSNPEDPDPSLSRKRSYPYSVFLSAHSRLIPAFVETGIWRVWIDPGLGQVGLNQPLLSSGVAGAGNQLLMEIMADNKARFAVDSWGYHLKESEPHSAKLPGPTPLRSLSAPRL